MKSAIASLALVAGLVAAQTSKLPSCANSCVEKYTTGSGIASCQQLDVKCICSNSSFLSGIACCLTASCDASDQAAAVKYAQEICSSAGVTVPDTVVCSSGASSAAAETATGSASSGSGSSSSAASAAASGSSTESAASGASTTSGSASATGSGTAAASASTTASSGGAAGTSAAMLGAAMAVMLAI